MYKLRDARISDQSTTFYGFCDKHDKIFNYIEDYYDLNPFIMDNKRAFLYAYKALAFAVLGFTKL